MAGKTIQFIALLCMGLSLIAPGAHTASMPNKIGMAEADYFIAQRAYDGWWMLGLAWVAAVIANAALAVSLRDQRPAFFFALGGLIAMLVTFGIFFMWTHAANQATANWTTVPENWEALRTRWEYSHAVNAFVVLLGFCSVALAVMTARD
jgi:hypothetical protein